VAGARARQAKTARPPTTLRLARARGHTRGALTPARNACGQLPAVNCLRLTVSSTTPRLEPRCPPVLETALIVSHRSSCESCFSSLIVNCFMSFGELI
jgi:hypothetical protein